MTDPNRFLRRRGAVVALTMGLTLVAGSGIAGQLDEVLAHFDEAQGELQTLSADFRETTTNLMLKDPIVAQGRFFMTKPDSIRWEYATPEVMSFVIARDEYTGYFPSQKRAEKRNIRRWSDRLFRFIGLGKGSEELAGFYHITLGDSSDAREGEILLMLDPRKRRARKRVEEVRFWLDASTYLPRRIEYRTKKGNSRLIEFTDVRLNPDLAAGLFTVEIPADVEVTTGFSGLPSFSPGATQ